MALLVRTMAGGGLLLSLLVTPLLALAGSQMLGERLPAITLIIDDMGNRALWGEVALKIPGPVTYSFLPHTPHARALARRAHAAGKEVMLHLPMESHNGNRLGPGGLTLQQSELELKRTLQEDLDAIPHVRGVNNHMGSLLTGLPNPMGWVMQGLSERPPLFFIDSRTSGESLAQRIAQEYGVPNARRDIFLDNERDPDAIRAQFELLVKRAKKRGYAIGIGHPYPETSAVLQELVPELAASGVRLITASEMIKFQQRKTLWQLPLSPSPKVAKSLKP